MRLLRTEALEAYDNNIRNQVENAISLVDSYYNQVQNGTIRAHLFKYIKKAPPIYIKGQPFLLFFDVINIICIIVIILSRVNRSKFAWCVES